MFFLSCYGHEAFGFGGGCRGAVNGPSVVVTLASTPDIRGLFLTFSLRGTDHCERVTFFKFALFASSATRTAAADTGYQGVEQATEEEAAKATNEDGQSEELTVSKIVEARAHVGQRDFLVLDHIGESESGGGVETIFFKRVGKLVEVRAFVGIEVEHG